MKLAKDGASVLSSIICLSAALAVRREREGKANGTEVTSVQCDIPLDAEEEALFKRLHRNAVATLKKSSDAELAEAIAMYRRHLTTAGYSADEGKVQ